MQAWGSSGQESTERRLWADLRLVVQQFRHAVLFYKVRNVGVTVSIRFTASVRVLTKSAKSNAGFAVMFAPSLRMPGSVRDVLFQLSQPHCKRILPRFCQGLSSKCSFQSVGVEELKVHESMDFLHAQRGSIEDEAGDFTRFDCAFFDDT